MCLLQGLLLLRLDFKTNTIKKARSIYWPKLNEEINAVDKITATMQYSAVLVRAIISQYE